MVHILAYKTIKLFKFHFIVNLSFTCSNKSATFIYEYVKESLFNSTLTFLINLVQNVPKKIEEAINLTFISDRKIKLSNKK